MAVIFGAGEPKGMFKHLKTKWINFNLNPTEERLFDTLYPMYHMREWIYQGNVKDYAGKYEAYLSREQILDKTLWSLPEYLALRSLCNHTKHFKPGPSKVKHTRVFQGANTEPLRCNDPSCCIHFTVDNRDIRDIFLAVYLIYHEYFEPKTK